MIAIIALINKIFVKICEKYEAIQSNLINSKSYEPEFCFVLIISSWNYREVNIKIITLKNDHSLFLSNKVLARKRNILFKVGRVKEMSL